ncbi:MAG: hypothetical protein GC179_04395 [Anaerolineaceae bacterium]|nr:hypothetical protein [Anaerolineaceae bacterium]
MSDKHDSVDSLLAALRELRANWLAKSQEADKKGRQLGVGNIQQALYQRGIAEGLRSAVADIEQLVTNEKHVTDSSTEISYAYVSREAALTLLGQAGIHITELHQHEDNTFSAMLPPLQVISFQERLEKLRTIADITILAAGKLPNTNKGYVDFAFSSPYSP